MKSFDIQQILIFLRISLKFILNVTKTFKSMSNLFENYSHTTFKKFSNGHFTVCKIGKEKVLPAQFVTLR